MRSLPLPLALTARLTPVVVLACAGWALSASPATPQASSTGHRSGASAPDPSAAPSASSASTSTSYSTASSPCSAVSASTVGDLVPGAKSAGKEIPSTDPKLRRTCSWNALHGYAYHWLDVSYEISGSADEATQEYQQQVSRRTGGGSVPGLGDSAYSVVGLSTEDKQQTREGVVIVRVSNALVVVTYSGSDFDTKKAPGTDEVNKGAIKVARAAVGALGGGQSGSASGSG
ncbi:hypothetical protein GTY81_16210 [Streptomyces sp. SID8366]|uniref:hypothetical protein n=1 Tax=unclassified Streptomyces TaxID=2593676 RepID=UPI000DB98922|nr:hypothetical protein [Streptomyces sp. PsTaAH-130]MYU05406.1 hypothetical protein [Streptomyces sp. SID8366]MYU66627.1 hypothetical protein [Streptomyces sp. SID69]